ncbi:hypothetical protein AAY473_016120 [Plecturocebus cupreus]
MPCFPVITRRDCKPPEASPVTQNRNFLCSSDRMISASSFIFCAGITDVSHHARPISFILKNHILLVQWETDSDLYLQYYLRTASP